MAQVKIHVSSSIKEEVKEKLALEIRKSISEGLSIDDIIGQAMVYESEYRGNHYSRSRDFVFVEISMYEGTRYEAKRKLANIIIDKVEQISGIDREDINVVYYETTKENFFEGSKDL